MLKCISAVNDIKISDPNKSVMTGLLHQIRSYLDTPPEIKDMWVLNPVRYLTSYVQHEINARNRKIYLVYRNYVLLRNTNATGLLFSRCSLSKIDNVYAQVKNDISLCINLNLQWNRHGVWMLQSNRSGILLLMTFKN